MKKGLMKIDFILSFFMFLFFVYFLFNFFLNFKYDYNEDEIIKPNFLYDYITKINCKLCYTQNNTIYYMIWDFNKINNLNNCSYYIEPYNDERFYFTVLYNNKTYSCKASEIPYTNKKYIRIIAIYDNGSINLAKVIIYA